MNARCALVLKSGSKAIVILNLLATLERAGRGVKGPDEMREGGKEMKGAAERRKDKREK